jgi:hypothetical protein
MECGMVMENEHVKLLEFASCDRQRECVEALIKHGTQNKAAHAMGLARSTFQKHIKRVFARSRGDSPVAALERIVEKQQDQIERMSFPDRSKAKAAHEHEATETEQTKNGFVVVVRTLERIKTASEAMEKAGIDLAIWKPIKVVANSWEVAVREEDKSITTYPLWQVKVTCERRVPESIELAVDTLAKRVFAGRFTWPDIKHNRPKRDPSKLVVGLVDHHFGKLCWKPEVLSSYDLKIATELYARAIVATQRQCEARRADIEEIIMPVGNDFAHVDNRAGATEAGTPQDSDGRYEKLAGVMEEALIRSVEEARKIAPVRVIWVGGNHDRVTSMWLCRCIHWAFEGDRHVTVDTAPCPVKYTQFGQCLLGFAHGEAPKMKALQVMMTTERADDWAKSKACREWITGHFHSEKMTERIGTYEESGQVFRVLPSLCGTDSYHYRNGYSMSRKATQNLLYSFEHGITAVFHESVERLMRTQ